jgi:hypothetical protein
MYSKLLILSLLFAAVLSNPIPISSTGVNGGSFISAYSTDPNWKVEFPDGNIIQAIVVDHNTANDVYWYVPSSYQWISVQGDQDYSDTSNMEVGYFVYTSTFDLTGLDPTSASLSGNFVADDFVAVVFLNGNEIGFPNGGYGGETGYSINSGFVSGINIISFYAYNQGGPAGFGASFSGSANPITAQGICNNANPADWTWGQGYYCESAAIFVQCWGSDPVQSAHQPCAAGTACACPNGIECSKHGTESPCR